jgi:hypothetical protein
VTMSLSLGIYLLLVYEFLLINNVNDTHISSARQRYGDTVSEWPSFRRGHSWILIMGTSPTLSFLAFIFSWYATSKGPRAVRVTFLLECPFLFLTIKS